MASSFTIRPLSAAATSAQFFPSPAPMVGGAGDDTIVGTATKDILYGQAGNDLLDGRAGPDTMNGGTGNDTYVVDSVGDLVIEAPGAGTDTVRASIGHTLAANVENLVLTGSAVYGGGNILDNALTGSAAANYLEGRVGNDTISGGAGADIINGGSGNDVLIGGAGSDRFVFSASEGADRINDYQTGVDQIALRSGHSLSWAERSWGVELNYGSDGVVRFIGVSADDFQQIQEDVIFI